MKVLETTECDRIDHAEPNTIKMPFGLLGFEHLKEYMLLASPEEAPFLWLETPQDDSVSFLVISPFVAMPNYQPELSREDVAFLALKKPEDAMIFNIVTLRSGNQATVNLKGPIVLNRHSLVAKQVIPVNAANYQVQHPLPVAA